MEKTMAEQILQDFTPPAIIDAIEQNFIGYTSAYVRASGGQVHEEPELTWLYTGTLLSYYNSVIRTAITTSDPDATIKATLAFFQARHQRMSWWVMPSTRPRDLIQRLQTLGLTLGWQDTGMAIDLHNLKEPPSTPTDLTIERVEDEKTMQDWLRAFGPGFDLNEEDLASYSRLVTCVPPQQHPIGPFYLARSMESRSPLPPYIAIPVSRASARSVPSHLPGDRASVPLSPTSLCLTPAQWDTALPSCKPRPWASRFTAGSASPPTAPSMPTAGNLKLL